MRTTTVSSLSLRDLEYAVAVARERHFGRAAERCGVSQAALSEQLRKLEGVLGVTLFERTKRHVEPTARGITIIAQAETLLNDARRFLENAQRSAEPLTGELRLGVIATLGPYYLPTLLHKGRERFPRLVLHLTEGRTAELLARLRAGELDAVLLALPIPTDGVTVEPLFFEPFRLACPLDHPLALRETVRLRDLTRERLLLMEEGHCMRDQAIELCKVRRLDPHTRVASSLEMLRHMIAAGEGYSVLPFMATQRHADMGGLIRFRDLEDAAAGRRIGLVWRATETRAGDLRAVADFMKQTLPPGTLALTATGTPIPLPPATAAPTTDLPANRPAVVGSRSGTADTT
jgi:LysR family hydrogen peroxide-inducible transcriptional activator